MWYLQLDVLNYLDMNSHTACKIATELLCNSYPKFITFRCIYEPSQEQNCCLILNIKCIHLMNFGYVKSKQEFVVVVFKD